MKSQKSTHTIKLTTLCTSVLTWLFINRAIGLPIKNMRCKTATGIYTILYIFKIWVKHNLVAHIEKYLIAVRITTVVMLTDLFIRLVFKLMNS